MPSIGLSYHEYLNDPIWGEIPVTEVEWEIINTPTFRRLQHIKQMGMAYLSYPTANHRRFEHSIGTMYVADFLFEIISDVIQQSEIKIDINANMLQAVRLAALLHDIGHPPYSHAFEEITSKNPKLAHFGFKNVFKSKNPILKTILNNPSAYNHELFTQYIIESDKYIAPIIEKYHENKGFFPINEIALLSVGKAKFSGLQAFNSIISGDFDADRIDYICRDSYYCGFSQRFNISDLRRNLIISYPGDNLPLNISLKKEVISAITTLLWYRYRLSIKIHQDKKNRIATQNLIHLFNQYYKINFESQANSVTLEKNKLDLLIRIHTEYNDEDFNNLLREHTDPNKVDELLMGKIWEEVGYIDKKHLMPKERLWVHLFTQEPNLIPQIESKFRESVEIEDCLLDIRLAKAPKFKTLVKEETDKIPRSIFDNYYSPHGIMIDTFNTMSIFLYHPDRNSYLKITNKLRRIDYSDEFLHPVEGWRYNLYKAMASTYKDYLAQRASEKIIHPLEVLLTYMGIVDDLCDSYFGFSGWLQGDGRTQDCIKYVLDKVIKKCRIEPNIKWTEGKYSLDLFIYFEILSHAGLIDHVHTPIGGPGEHAPWFDSRIDRRISLRFGKPFYQKYLKTSWIYSVLHKDISSIFKMSKDSYDEFVKVEAALRKDDLLIDNYKKLSQTSFEIRNRLTGSGFPPLQTRNP